MILGMENDDEYDDVRFIFLDFSGLNWGRLDRWCCCKTWRVLFHFGPCFHLTFYMP